MVTEFEDTYHRLILIDPPLRRRWLLGRQPASVSPAHWWLALIEAAIWDLRSRNRGWPASRPRADIALAACLIDWALEQGFPLERAVGELTELIAIALDAGQQVDDLPANARPDAVARRALNGFAMTREQAITRAASLRATPLTEEDLVQPGEGMAAWQALAQTEDYRDYHRLLNIDRMLTDLTPLVDLIADGDLAAEVRAWLSVQPDLDPVPTVVALRPGETTVDPSQAD
jgi:hypothetical protein